MNRVLTDRKSTLTSELIASTARWFAHRDLTDAVVGYSGGVDSAVTAAILQHAGVNLNLVVAEAPNQRYSSPLGGRAGAARFLRETKIDGRVFTIPYSHLFSNDAANEAAAPIHRVAIFYGVCAELRATSAARPVTVGTANFDETAYLGFWGKASDGNQDFYPISHLHKSDVKLVANDLHLPVEILNAEPSGDLLFEETFDLKMTGADYSTIEQIARACEDDRSDDAIAEHFSGVPDPKKFADQVIKNGFKYDVVFPGFHLSDRLERFRVESYPRLLQIFRRLRKIS